MNDSARPIATQKLLSWDVIDAGAEIVSVR